MSNIITISGDPGSGKSTTIKALQKQFEEQEKKVIVYSTGAVFRQLASEKGMTVTEFNKFLENKTYNVDEKIDNAVIEFGKKIIEENDDSKVYIIDSRLAWFNIPSSFKVRLTIEDKVAGERVFNDKSRGEEDRYNSLEEATEATLKRKQSEIERYIKLYGKEADISYFGNFDINIDTSDFDPEEIAEIIIANMERIKRGEHVSKIIVSHKAINKRNEQPVDNSETDGR